MSPRLERSFHLSGERLARYSRRGNFHSDDDEARRLGLPGLVAQGMQVAAPAYGLVLDAWGIDFLARGTFECRFLGMVLEDEHVHAVVELEERTATFEVRRGPGDPDQPDPRRPVVVGAAHLDGPAVPPSGAVPSRT